MKKINLLKWWAYFGLIFFITSTLTLLSEGLAIVNGIVYLCGIAIASITVIEVARQTFLSTKGKGGE